LLLRAGARVRLLVGAARARPARARPAALALRLQRRGRDRPGAGRRGGAARPRARAEDPLGAPDDLELVAGDPARRRRPVRQAGVLLRGLESRPPQSYHPDHTRQPSHGVSPARRKERLAMRLKALVMAGAMV